MVGPSVYEFPRKKIARVYILNPPPLVGRKFLFAVPLPGACSEPTEHRRHQRTAHLKVPTPAPTATPAIVVCVAPDTVTMEPGDSLLWVAVDSLATGLRGGAGSGAVVGVRRHRGFRRPLPRAVEPGSYRVIARGANGWTARSSSWGLDWASGATPVTGNRRRDERRVRCAGCQAFPPHSACSRWQAAVQRGRAVFRGDLEHPRFISHLAGQRRQHHLQRLLHRARLKWVLPCHRSRGPIRPAAPVADTTVVTVGSVLTTHGFSPTLSSVVLDAGDGDGGDGGDAAVDRAGQDE